MISNLTIHSSNEFMVDPKKKIRFFDLGMLVFDRVSISTNDDNFMFEIAIPEWLHELRKAIQAICDGQEKRLENRMTFCGDMFYADVGLENLNIEIYDILRSKNVTLKFSQSEAVSTYRRLFEFLLDRYKSQGGLEVNIIDLEDYLPM